MSFQKRREQTADILERMYLLLFGIILLTAFLKITSFPIPWNRWFRNGEGILTSLANCFFEHPYYLLAMVAGLRFVVQRTYEWRQTAVAAFVFVSGYYLWTASGHERLFLFWLLIMGAWKIPFRKILAVFVKVEGAALAVTVFCAITGIIENYVYLRDDETVRNCFGIVAPTNFGAVVFFWILCWWYVRREKITYLEIAGVFGLGAFIQLGSDARCSMLLTITAGVLMLLGKWLRGKELPSLFADGLVLSPILCAIGMLILTISYQGTPFQEKLNSLLTARLGYGRKAFDVYAIKPFGQYIRLFGNAENEYVGYYFYIDSSYVQLVLMYGAVILGVVLLCFLLIGGRAKVQKDWTLLWIIGLAAIHSVIEQHLVELPYCPLIFALLADTESRSGLELKEIFGRRWIRRRQS